VSIEALLLLKVFWIVGSRTVFSDEMATWWTRAVRSIAPNLPQAPVTSRWTTLLRVSGPIVILLAAFLTMLGLPSTPVGSKLIGQGTPVVLLTYGSLWLMAFSCLWVLSAKARAPVIALALFGLLIYNQTDFGNRYKVREIQGHSVRLRSSRVGGVVVPLLRPSADRVFSAWLSSRTDR
jgi:hypothetical protein